MLKLDLYIHSTGCIAPEAAPDVPLKVLRCQEPDYSKYINPMQLRRMSRVVRMGVAAAKMALDSAGISRPDALSVGTAFGCLQDTEIFLGKMVAQDEKMLTPTAFIQSTHNTVAGQIALLTGCHGHNMTYVQGGHSFEQALIDTALYLAEHPGHTVLAGGIDELTDSSVSLLQCAGIYSTEPRAPQDITMQAQAGSIGGEGASFFAINKEKQGALLRLDNLCTFYANNHEDALAEIKSWLHEIQSEASQIDAVALGISGAGAAQAMYQTLMRDVFPGKPVAAFKRLCGEYPTAAAFALSCLVSGIKTGDFPPGFFMDDPRIDATRIMLINHYCDAYSCYLLERV